MELTYGAYLRIDRLLDLQHPRSDPEQHDEMLFIVIHQVYELWFKQVLHELDRLCPTLAAGDLFGAISTVERVRTIFKTLVGQLDILETMTPMSFSAFRDRLETSSGFQSVQYRELEYLLGYKRVELLRHHEHDRAGHARLVGRLDAPSVVDHFNRFLVTRGATLPPSSLERPARDATQPDPVVQVELLRLIREQKDAAILFELLLDVDEGLQEWRYRHVKLVERTIGNKKGTGDSMGVAFLKRSVYLQAFPDLWAIRHEL